MVQERLFLPTLQPLLRDEKMIRALASVNVVFMDLHFPMRVYIASSGDSLSLRMINPATGSTLKQKMVDASTGDEVNRDSCNHGYELSKDKMVIFTKDELASFRSSTNNRIDILECVSDPNIIDPINVERSYWLSADKNSDAMFNLFFQALSGSGNIAIGRWYTRSKDHLVAISIKGDSIIMHQLYYASEVRQAPQTNKVAVNPTTANLLTQALKKMSNAKFDLAKYHDTYVTAITQAAMQKEAGIKPDATPAPSINAIDSVMMIAKLEAMLASLSAKDAAPAATPVATPVPLVEVPVEKKKASRRKAG